jgi:hypothetical protein
LIKTFINELNDLIKLTKSQIALIETYLLFLFNQMDIQRITHFKKIDLQKDIKLSLLKLRYSTDGNKTNSWVSTEKISFKTFFY